MAIPNYMLYESNQRPINRNVATNEGCTIIPIVAKDFLGQELQVNDWVLFTEKSYRNFYVGKISKITPKTINISHISRHGKSYGINTLKQISEQVIKLQPNQVDINYFFEDMF